jgi:hypothetical protein
LRPPALGTNIFELRLIWSREYVLAIAKGKKKAVASESLQIVRLRIDTGPGKVQKQEDIPQQEM